MIRVICIYISKLLEQFLCLLVFQFSRTDPFRYALLTMLLYMPANSLQFHEFLIQNCVAAIENIPEWWFPLQVPIVFNDLRFSLFFATTESKCCY